MAKLKIFNSLTREKEDFTPLDENHVRLYACGPTVYNYAHIGNARMAVVFDLLSNVLREIYGQDKVTYVSNITDVDDKIIAAHKETGTPINEITEKFTTIYNEDMASLGCAVPDIQPKATEHIGEMIALCEQLIRRGHAYESEGHVLFHVPSFPNYGGLSGRSRDEQIAGARVEVASYKKDPADFVLWKPSAQDEPGWDSPWGYGRPGWHIECSAMAEKHLGLPFDIHGGGADLKFPHHENEIAQSCCAHGHTDLTSFSKYWMHNGFVTVEGEKMSKSLGNFLLAHDLLEKYDGEVLRLTLLSAHYRQPLDWSEQRIENMKMLLDKLYKVIQHHTTLAHYKDPRGYYGKAVPVPDAIMEALCNDLNTPQVIVELHKLAVEEKIAELKAAGDLLGILQKDPEKWLATEEIDISPYEALLQERAEAKAAKNFTRADEIRDELSQLGYKIIDTPDGAKLEKL